MKLSTIMSNCRTGETGRLTLAFFFLAACLSAQPVAGSIATQSLPFFGPTTFDAAGNMYVTSGGATTAGAAQTQGGGGTCLDGSPIGAPTAHIGIFPVPEPCSDAYIGKFDPNGNLIFGTLLGGPTQDTGSALAVDSAGNVYIVGTTGGSFPTTANAAISSSTTSTTFAAEVSADGSHFLYVTYLPASVKTVSAVAVDTQGNAYIVGQTGGGHAFLTELAAGGASFLYTVTLAGSGQEIARQIGLDAAGNPTIAGQTSSPDFPVTPGVVQAALAGPQNLFLAKFDPTGHTIFSTYLGGNGSDSPNVLQLDSSGNLYIAGSTTSFNFPTTPGSFQTTPLVPMWNNYGPGGFVAKLTPNGSALAYSSYVMSLDNLLQPGVAQLAVGASGDVYLAGLTNAGFPVTPSAPQPCFGGGDVFVVHLDPNGATLDSTYVSGANAGASANFAFGLGIPSEGPLTLVWHAAGNNSISRITFGSGGWTAPACLSSSVLNDAAFYANGAVAPGEIISLTGFGIGPDAGVSYQPTAQGTFPAEVGGVQVLFNSQPVPVIYAQSRQVNAIVPTNISGSASISLVYNGTPIGSTAVTVSFGVPGLYRAQPGFSSQLLGVNEDGTLNSQSNPAASGSVVMLLGTGFGVTDPPCTAGGLNDDFAANLASPLSVTMNQPSQVVTYAGSAPTLPCGVTQINLRVSGDPGPMYLQAWSVMSIAGGAETAEGNFITSMLWVK